MASSPSAVTRAEISKLMDVSPASTTANTYHRSARIRRVDVVRKQTCHDARLTTVAVHNASARRAFGQDALQGAPVHVEAPRRLADIVAAQFVDALDVLPADAVGAHRVFRRLGLVVGRGE